MPSVGTEIMKTRAETPAMVTPKMELIENQTANGFADYESMDGEITGQWRQIMQSGATVKPQPRKIF